MPEELGITGFPAYYPYQDTAIQYVTEQVERIRLSGDPGVCALELPTGGGKSLVPAVLQALTGLRVVVLAPTKSLQSQYMRQFQVSLNMHDIRGRNSYQCAVDTSVTVDDGPCVWGQQCSLMKPEVGGCSYYDAYYDSVDASLVTTNPSYWMTQSEYGRGLGKVDVLVCDEADALFDTLGSFLAVPLYRHHVRRLLGIDLPDPEDKERLTAWCILAASRAESLSDASSGGKTREAIRRTKELRELANGLKRVLRLGISEWVHEPHPRNNEGFTLHPIWPADFIEEYLYRGVPAVVLMSATLPEDEVVDLVQMTPRTFTYRSYPSRVPIESRKVVHIKTVAMTHARQDVVAWVNRFDQIITPRMDRRILFHTTSYERRNRVLMGSRFADDRILLSHGSEDLEQAYQEFKLHPVPAVLVSPSLTRGYDFPYDACRTNIIGKIPWPDSRNPVVKARTDRFSDYPSKTAMKTIIQELGRGVRNVDDWCENFVIDDSWRWFSKKYRHFMTKSFEETVQWRSVDVIPAPRPLDS